MKAIIFDSSSLINFTMNGLLEEFRGLKKLFGGKFLITKEVKEEIVDKPMKIKRFELEALKLKQLMLDGIIEMPSSIGIDDNKISKLSKEMEDIANNTFFGSQSSIHIISAGESSCLALSRLLNEQGMANVLSIDERTIRVLGEKPENLLAIFQKKLHTSIKMKKENLRTFANFKFIRSTELIYIAYKKGVVRLTNNNVIILDALLYGLKLNGCSISDEEIEEIKRIG